MNQPIRSAYMQYECPQQRATSTKVVLNEDKNVAM